MLLQLCTRLQISSELQTKVVAALLKWDHGAVIIVSVGFSTVVGGEYEVRPVYASALFQEQLVCHRVTLVIDQCCY